MRTCTKCREEKPESAYTWLTKEQKYRTICRACRNKQDRESWYKLHGGAQERQLEQRRQKQASPTRVCTSCGIEKPKDAFYWVKALETYHSHCKFCCNERSRECSKKYYEENREEVREKHKQWYEENKEERQKQLIKYNKEHPEITTAVQARYYERNREARCAARRNWRENNLENDKANSAKRRTRKNLAGGFWTVEEWLALKEYYGYMCLCCKLTEPEIKLVADHIIPVSKGGSSYIDNIQPLCVTCNNKKFTKTIDYRVSTG